MAEPRTGSATHVQARNLYPQTPEPDWHDGIRTIPSMPPSPPRLSQAKLKVKRRRNATDSSPSQPSLRFPVRQASRAYHVDLPTRSSDGLEAYDAETPLPSIEISSVHSASPPFTATPSLSEYTIKADGNEPPPCTPVHQVSGNDNALIQSSEAWDFSSDEPAVQYGRVTDSRPSTANSAFTRATFQSQIDDDFSTGTAATSPDLNPTPAPPVKAVQLDSPFAFKLHDDLTDKVRRPNSMLNEEQDRHLWGTYMRYLEDATHTPFKMLPGSLPPTGVTERVVREARKTWKALRLARINKPQGSLDPMSSNSTTGQSRGIPSQWPVTDGVVRKRLHMLCKRKPMLAPHYARMIYRTPSPFTSSTTQPSSVPPAPLAPRRDTLRNRSHGLPSEDNGTTDFPSDSPPTSLAFSTRELNVTLATSTADSMQPGGFLAQLGRSSHTPPAVSTHPGTESPTKRSVISQGSCRLDSNKRPNPYLEEGFAFDATKLGLVPKKATIPPHQRSQSLHHNFFGRSGLFGSAQLASPFAPHVRPNRAETVREPHASLPPLLSPFQMEQPTSKRLCKASKMQRPQLSMDPLGPSHFRRQSHDAVQAAISHPPVVRNRGFTLSALQGARGSQFGLDNSLHLHDHPQEMDELTAVGSSEELASSLSFLSDPPRLSSPFRPGLSAKTFPRMHAATVTHDTIMSDAPLVAPQPRRRLHGIVRPPPDNATLATWRSLPRGASPL